MATVYERRSEIAREQGYASLYDRTQSRAAAKDFFEENDDDYTPAKADALAAFAREHEAGTMSREAMFDWYRANVNPDADEDELYDFLREWTDSGETV